MCPGRTYFATQKASWREDVRRVDDGAQVRWVTELALKRGLSIGFSGYYQRHIKAPNGQTTYLTS